MTTTGDCRGVKDVEKRTLQQVTFNISWAEFESHDAEYPEPDKGWYVDVTTPDGQSHDIGPDYFGDGLATVEEALALCEKWATDRGFTYSPPAIEVTVGRWVDG